MRALLVLLVACRGDAPPSASGSGSSAPRDAMTCAPAKVTLAVHEDHPVACWDGTCVRRGGERIAKAARPSAWIRPAEIRMDQGVLSVCNDSCRPLQARVAETIAGTDPAQISATTDLEIAVAGTTVWRTRLDHPMSLVPPQALYGKQSAALPTRIVVAGNLLVVTFDGHGQIYDRAGGQVGTDLHAWEPGEVVQLDEHAFLITDRIKPRFGTFDVVTGRMLSSHDLFAGFTIEDAVRLPGGAGALLLSDDAAFTIATIVDGQIVTLEQLARCR